MKRYYAHYYQEFENTYNLYYVDDSMNIDIPDSWRQISRKKAEKLAREERKRRKSDPSFAYRADGEIYPADLEEEYDIENPKKYFLDDVIWKKK